MSKLQLHDQIVTVGKVKEKADGESRALFCRERIAGAPVMAGLGWIIRAAAAALPRACASVKHSGQEHARSDTGHDCEARV